MAPVTVLFCLMLWTSGKALRHCSMPLFTVCKNLAVVGTTLYEYVKFGNSVSTGIRVSLAMMTLGSVVAGLGDMSATPIGLLWLLANVVVTISYLAVLKERMPADVSSASKTLHNNILTLIIFALVSASAGELSPFMLKISAQTRTFQIGVLTTGVLGTAINMTTFWCMHVTNGATYAFVGASNKIPVALIGHFVFHSVITTTGWCGVTLGLASGLVYAMTRERERQQRDAETQHAGEGEKLLDSPDSQDGDEGDAEWSPLRKGAVRPESRA
jgi:GDP-mannose transporter